MEKWQVENSEKLEISEISEKLFRVFLFRIFDFSLQPNRKLRFKILEKNSKISEIFDFSEFSTWPGSLII